MGEAQIIELAGQLMWLVLLMSMPIIVSASVVGLLVSLFQALTQIQDQTIAFLVKLVTACITLALTYQWMGEAIMNYTQRCMDMITQMGT